MLNFLTDATSLDAPVTESRIPDYDRDSIHTLPLSVVPIKNPGLKRARMIKNVRLDTRIELYRTEGMGSGQIGIDEIPDFFERDDALDDDIDLLRRVSAMKSFDAYSLRRSLRDAGIKVEENAAFMLSDAKKRELFPFMRNLTRPLIRHLYGSGDVDINDTHTLMDLIAKPDPSVVMPRLQKMADSLDTPLELLPRMLEDYGDIFLSLSYYRSYFVYVVPKVDGILDWMREVQSSSVVRSNPQATANFRMIEQIMRYVSKGVTQRFNQFDRNIVVNWDNITLGTFNQVRALITAHHASLAEVLCGLTVKVYEWEQKFPNKGGSPERRSDFLIGEIKPGLDKLQKAERSAPRF